LFPDKESEGVERELSELIIHFMKTEVVYTVKRLLAADVKLLFVGPTIEENMDLSGLNPFHPGRPIKQNEKKGGLLVTRRITYDR